MVFFCACFVLFESPMKLRETAIEQESLQTAYSFLTLVTIFGSATPLLYVKCSFKHFSMASWLGWAKLYLFSVTLFCLECVWYLYCNPVWNFGVCYSTAQMRPAYHYNELMVTKSKKVGGYHSV